MLMFLIGFLVGTVIVGAICNDILKSSNATRYKPYFLLLNRWLCKKQEGKDTKDWFRGKKYHRVCIYGLAEIGERLISEIESSDIKISCGIDKRVIKHDFDFPVYRMKDIQEISQDFDVIVVTPFYYFEEIHSELVKCFNCDIVSIDEVV